MAKKSFKNNPAMQFITPPEAAAEQAGREAAEMAAWFEEGETAQRAARQGEEGKGAAPKARAGTKPQGAKNAEAAKGQGSAPVAASSPEKPAAAPAAEDAPAQNTQESPPPPMKLNPMYIETRSKRVQLLMQPTLHTRLREMAAARGQSLNDLVHEALEKLAEGN